MDQEHTVTTRLDERTFQKLEDATDNKSKFVREAIREKLDRPTVNTRIEQLEDEIEEIRTALIREAEAPYRDYGFKAGDRFREDPKK